MYARKFPEKLDATRKHSEVAITIGDDHKEVPHKLTQEGVVNFNQTKGFKDVADAPSFSLGLTDDEDSQETHRGHLVKYVPSIEDEKLYNEICKHNRLHGGQDNSPMFFQSDKISLSAHQIAKGMTMGKSLNTNAMDIGTYVLSEDPRQKRRKIFFTMGCAAISQRGYVCQHG